MTACPGCGVTLPVLEYAAEPLGNASRECWQLYAELAFYTLSLRDPFFLHQLIVDAYGAQHVGEKSKPIGVCFALIGLYVSCEKHFTGKEVQNEHVRLAKRSKTWPRLLPPQSRASMTIADVLSAEAGEARDGKIKDWAHAVWAMWEQEQGTIRALYKLHS